MDALVLIKGRGGPPAFHSCRHQRLEAFHIQRQAHQVPLALRLLQSPETETPKAQHVFDPTVRRFRQPLALCISGPACHGRQLLLHASLGRIGVRIHRHRLPTFPAQRHITVNAPRLQLRQVRFVAVAGTANTVAGCSSKVSFTSSSRPTNSPWSLAFAGR